MNIILDVVTGMSECLTNDQIERLKYVLTKCMKDYDIKEKTTEIAVPYQATNEEYLKRYFAWKSTEGKSEKTLKHYKFILCRALGTIQKPIPEITEDDLFMYLSMVKYQGASNTYLRDIRQDLSALFTWLCSKNLIPKNPMLGVSPIKTEKTIKSAFSDVEIEQLRRATTNKRDFAIIEVLYSTGMRISEMVALNRNDIDMINKSIKVLGKGKKERYVYLSNTAVYYLQDYLKERQDTGMALFVGLRKPYKRMDVSAVQSMLRVLGEKTGIEKVHPHRFRRTLATNLLRKGMSIEEVSMILGHEKLDTTKIYCNVDREMVMNQYKRIMCA